MSTPLDQEEIQKLNDAAAKVKRGDLYNALHRVGDDPIKSGIEEVLSLLLTKEEFNKVVAVFNIMTDEDSDF
jgi:hypothetical protein